VKVRMSNIKQKLIFYLGCILAFPGLLIASPGLLLIFKWAEMSNDSKKKA
jgi:hypothetical protein